MSEQRVGKHKLVQFTYTITDDSGSVVEQVDLPVNYVHGAGSGMWDKIEQALEGARPGERVEVALSPEEGFGPHREELTFTDDIDNVPPQFRHVGAEVEMHNDAGDVKTFVVSRIADGKLTVDGNHPLAGKRLTFLIEIREVRGATGQEVRDAGTAGGPVLH